MNKPKEAGNMSDNMEIPNDKVGGRRTFYRFYLERLNIYIQIADKNR